jgi:anti-anti-sigma factor
LSEDNALRVWPSAWISPADRPVENVLRLSGDLDVSTAHAVTDLLEQHARTSRSSVIIIDLRAVTFMDSSGMDPLIKAHRDLSALERLMVLASTPRPVWQLFHVVRPLGDYPLLDETFRAAATADIVGLPDNSEAADIAHLVREATHLRAARQARAVLEQAKGLLMGVHECDASQAEALLTLVASRRFVAVDDIALGLVAMANVRGHSGEPTTADPVLHAAVQATLGRVRALED